MSVIAVLVAAFGLYGTMAYLVVERTREIAIRVVLGSDPAHISRLVVGQSVALVAVGLVAGILGGGLLTRSLQGLLFSVTPLDAWTFLEAVLLFVVVATVAALVPARRAVRLDAFAVLRSVE